MPTTAYWKPGRRPASPSSMWRCRYFRSTTSSSTSGRARCRSGDERPVNCSAPETGSARLLPDSTPAPTPPPRGQGAPASAWGRRPELTLILAALAGVREDEVAAVHLHVMFAQRADAEGAVRDRVALAAG